MHAQKMLLVPLLAPPGSLSGPSWPHFWRGVLLLSVYDTESIKNPRDMLAWDSRKAPPTGYFEGTMDPFWHPLKQLWTHFSTRRDL